MKGFNSYYALLILFVYSLERITFDKKVRIKEVVNLVNKIIPQKTYTSQNRVYQYQSRVDVLTQFQIEFNLIQQKIPGLDLTFIKH